MKIGIDCIVLNNVSTGTGQYVYSLIKGLNEHDRVNEYVLFSPYENNLEFELSGCFRWKRLQTVALGKNINKILWEQYYIVEACRQEGVELLHTPYMSFPFFTDISHLATVYDIAGFCYKEYRKKIKSKLYYFLVALGIKKAERLLTISEYSKNEIVRFFQFKSDAIKVIYPAVGQEGPGAEERDVRKKFALSKKFILYVGADDYRKNLPMLIEAYKKISTANRSHYDLVIAGNTGVFDVKGVRSLGFVDRQELICLYKAASLFVYPSLYEGVGLPVLEAMHYGVAVVASYATAIPEIVGDAAFLVSPHNATEISEAINAVLGDAPLRSNLIERGKRRAASFTFERLAAGHISFYKTIETEKGGNRDN